jgi:hypothetical protein
MSSSFSTVHDPLKFKFLRFLQMLLTIMGRDSKNGKERQVLFVQDCQKGRSIILYPS